MIQTSGPSPGRRHKVPHVMLVKRRPAGASPDDGFTVTERDASANELGQDLYSGNARFQSRHGRRLFQSEDFLDFYQSLYGLNGGRDGVRAPDGARFFSYSSRRNQPRLISRGYRGRGKRPGHEAGHSPPALVSRSRIHSPMHPLPHTPI